MRKQIHKNRQTNRQRQQKGDTDGDSLDRLRDLSTERRSNTERDRQTVRE